MAHKIIESVEWLLSHEYVQYLLKGFTKAAGVKKKTIFNE